jgi:hypothetical protein
MGVDGLVHEVKEALGGSDRDFEVLAGDFIQTKLAHTNIYQPAVCQFFGQAWTGQDNVHLLSRLAWFSALPVETHLVKWNIWRRQLDNGRVTQFLAKSIGRFQDTLVPGLVNPVSR